MKSLLKPISKEFAMKISKIMLHVDATCIIVKC